MRKISSLINNKNFILLLVSDVGLILFSVFLSSFIRYEFQVLNEFILSFNQNHVFIFVFLKILSFRSFGLYRGMWRYTSVWDLFNIFKANTLATILIILCVYFFRGFSGLSRSVFIIDFILCAVLVSLSRLGIRVFFSHILSSIEVNYQASVRKKIILIGAGDTGQIILRQILVKHRGKYEVIGFLDDNLNKIGSRIHDVEVLDSIKNIQSINKYYDEIYICIPSASTAKMREIVNFCKLTEKPFKTLPSISEVVEGKISLSQLREVSLVDLLGRDEVSLDKKSINRFIKGKRILVTGAGGSIGSELVNQCVKFNPSILVMVEISELNLFEIERRVLAESSDVLFKPVLSDIRDLKTLDQIFLEFQPQIVFHAAAYKHVPMQESFPWEAVKTNVFGTNNVAEISVKHGVEKFVLVSTDKAVKPTNVMGATKRLAEIISQNYNRISPQTEFMAVRFGNVLGSSGSVIPIFQEQIKNGGPLTITDPDMERYFMSIPEASQLILQAGSIGVGGEVFILDMGDPIKIVDIASELIRLSGYEPDLDIPIKITGTRPGEKKIEELSLPTEKLDGTRHDRIFVLNNIESNQEQLSKIVKDIEKLKVLTANSKPNQIRLLLSSVLPEYEPEDDPIFLNFKGVEA